MKESKYKGGQVIQMKSYEELKADVYASVYSDEQLKAFSNAQFAIYGVIPDQRKEVWYEIGQWGHYVKQVPESYIKCEYRANVEVSSEKTEEYKKKLASFTEMLKEGVISKELRCSDLKAIIEEVCSDGKESKEKEKSGEFLRSDNSGFMRGRFVFRREPLFPKFINPMIIEKLQRELMEAIDNSVLPCGCHCGCDLGKGESKTGFAVATKENGGWVTTSQANSLWADKGAKYDRIEHFRFITEMVETKISLFNTRIFRSEVNEGGIDACVKWIDKSFSSWKTMKINDLSCIMELYCLALFAIYSIVYLENPKEKNEEKRIKAFHSVTARMIDLYRRKNNDYGDSFTKSLDEDGILVAKIRIGDKVSRFCTLASKRAESKVKDESLIDTLIVMANYSVMTIMWLVNNQIKTEHNEIK